MKTLNLTDQAGKSIGSITLNPFDFGLVFRSADMLERIKAIATPLSQANIKANGTGKNESSAAIVEMAEQQFYEAFDDFLQPENSTQDLFKKNRPFATVKGQFFCTQVIHQIVSYIVQQTDEALETFCKEHPFPEASANLSIGQNTDIWRVDSNENYYIDRPFR